MDRDRIKVAEQLYSKDILGVMDTEWTKQEKSGDEYQENVCVNTAD